MKKLAAVLALIGLVASLAACGGAFTCNICGEEKTGGRKTQEVAGMKVTVCDDCVGGIQEGIKGLSDLFN